MPAGLPFGLNLFAPPGHGTGAAQVAGYADTLRAEVERSGTVLGEPRWDDDRYAEKLDLVCAEHVPVVSFTFGCPSVDEVRRLRDAGAAVWVTVITADEARTAYATGVDALIAQGFAAGGHRGAFDDACPATSGCLRCCNSFEPPSVTVPAHRSAIEDGHASTALTRAFTGRTARGVINRSCASTPRPRPVPTPRCTI